MDNYGVLTILGLKSPRFWPYFGYFLAKMPLSSSAKIRVKMGKLAKMSQKGWFLALKWPKRPLFGPIRSSEMCKN